MIDLKLINSDFKQTGNICVISTYGFVIEYYSQKKLLTSEVISNFIDFFPNLKSQIDKKWFLSYAKINPLNEKP